ncbi:hypothetical protein CHLRE_04g217976v5 [Chlamydomonas reinhardtii]|uniref:Uncharacterized protein n=1 Tax=Chlamydomonas reinhardtii TaxID=3055 RepID=A0A2K3DTL4_CHLRE|nr:uncharacterized protein CHLRE_04g217976v5 [Chlamydomonas reinhardtii]PNW83880.1 hypothetical protein CHLRE_04g217976v5 [Chlamydomonas reinhardtii]
MLCLVGCCFHQGFLKADSCGGQLLLCDGQCDLGPSLLGLLLGGWVPGAGLWCRP